MMTKDEPKVRLPILGETTETEEQPEAVKATEAAPDSVPRHLRSEPTAREVVMKSATDDLRHSSLTRKALLERRGPSTASTSVSSGKGAQKEEAKDLKSDEAATFEFAETASEDDVPLSDPLPIPKGIGFGPRIPKATPQDEARPETRMEIEETPKGAATRTAAPPSTPKIDLRPPLRPPDSPTSDIPRRPVAPSTAAPQNLFEVRTDERLTEVERRVDTLEQRPLPTSQPIPPRADIVQLERRVTDLDTQINGVEGVKRQLSKLQENPPPVPILPLAGRKETGTPNIRGNGPRILGAVLVAILIILLATGSSVAVNRYFAPILPDGLQTKAFDSTGLEKEITDLQTELKDTKDRIPEAKVAVKSAPVVDPANGKPLVTASPSSLFETLDGREDCVITYVDTRATKAGREKLNFCYKKGSGLSVGGDGRILLKDQATYAEEVEEWLASGRDLAQPYKLQSGVRVHSSWCGITYDKQPTCTKS
jgi:hypothetical protein